jgi:protein-disulfide isomerase
MEPSSQQSSSLVIPIAIVFGFGLIALAIYFSGIGKPANENYKIQAQNNNAEAVIADIKPVDGTDYIKGNPNAPIMIVEYSDYDCPFCKSFHETMNRIMDEYGVTGKVAWVYRQFPISQLHPNAPRISEAALCVGELAGNDGFWSFSDLVFQSRAVNEITSVSRLSEFAVDAGADKEAYENCVRSEKYQQAVKDSIVDGVNAGVKGTPHSFVVVGNQKAEINGAQPYPMVKKAIDDLLGQLNNQNPETDTNN